MAILCRASVFKCCWKRVQHDCSLSFRVGLPKHADEMAGEKAISTASKPIMRGLLNASIKRNLIFACTIAGLSGLAYRVIIGSERKRRYAEFYRTYDADKEFEEMRKKGLFQSC